jgi:F-type H+-transporting ATPase subunit b
MTFNAWTFLLELLNFLVLVYVLRRLLYRPLHEAIDRRREANARAQAEAERAREEAAALQRQLNDRMADLERHREELIRKAREQAEAERKATLAQVEGVGRQRREDAERQLERERAEALQGLRAELVQSAVALAERFLREASNSTLQEQLAWRLVEELRHVPEDQVRRLREELEEDETAVVETAADLDGEILQNLNGALNALAGRSVLVSLQTLPGLLGGLRLRLGGHVWDASLSGGMNELAPAPSGSLSP